MPRKTPNLTHAVNAVFYIGQTELAEQLAVFAKNKRLAWSPEVKIAMQKRPAAVIEDDVFFKLKPLQASVLQGMLVSLLKPIKEHSLFDLSDWLRDLDGVPEYLQVYWTNTRVPKELDEVVAKALRTESSNSMAANPAWPLPPSRSEPPEVEDDDVDMSTEPPTPVAKKKVNFRAKKQTFVKPNGAKPVTPKGPANKGKYTKPEPEFVGAVDSSIDVLVDEACQALGDKQMVKVASKAVWTRVHKAVDAMLQVNGMALSTTTRPQRVATDDPKQARVTYYLARAGHNYPDNGWHDFKAAFAFAFDGVVVDVQAVNDEEPPKSFKVWYQHA